MLKNYLVGIKKISGVILLFVLIISGIISYSVLNKPVAYLIQKNIADYTLEIDVLEEYNDSSSPNREVWINDIMLNNESDMEVLFQSADVEGFEFRTAEEYGYNNNVIVNTRQENGKISFHWIGGSEDYITFWMQNLSGEIQLTLKKQQEILDTEKVDLYTDAPDSYYTYSIGEYQDTPTSYVILQYSCIAIGTILLFLAINIFLSKKIIDFDQKDKTVNH